MNLYDLDGVSKVYGDAVALHPTTLSVAPGRSLGIIGESGSGKTTLTRIMLGLLRPTEGTAYFEGERISLSSLGISNLRRSVQLVLQDPFGSLNPRMRIGQIIAEPLALLKVPGNHSERVAEVLTSVGLNPDWTKRYPHELSGGQRQRVAIARAIAPSPRVLVADEPVSALDVSVRAQVLDVLHELKEAGLTLILVSHDLGIVEHMCEDTLVLAGGQVVEHDETETILSHPSHPVTKELLNVVPRLPR